MFLPVWQRVVRGSYCCLPVRLEDHVRLAVKSAGYPGIVPQVGAAVDGLLYLDVEAADLVRLDHFEGLEYVRLPVAVSCGEKSRWEAETYIYRDRSGLSDTPWDPTIFDIAAFISEHCR